MPLPPPDPAAAGHAANPARVLLDSPLAAATRGRVLSQRTRSRPHERGLRILALVGTLLVHLFFLFGFVLGAAYQPTLPSLPPGDQVVQVRMVEAPPPPPPPPVRGTPPKERGPRHQGRRSPSVAVGERSANVEAVAPAVPPPAPPAIAVAPKTTAAKVQPLAMRPPPVSLPQPSPPPEPKALVPAGAPPVLAVPAPQPQPPVPPEIQPEPVRPPQEEGNRPLLPPASLAQPTLPTPAPAPMTLPSMALHIEVPTTVAPVSVIPASTPPAAPEVPRLQPLPLPAQAAPVVVQQTPALAPIVLAPHEQPLPQAPAVTPAAPTLQVAPAPIAAPASTLAATVPLPKIELKPSARAQALRPSVLRPSIPAPGSVADVVAASTTPTQASEPKPAAPAANPESAMAPISATSNPANTPADVSRAPDATAQGSDNAIVGEPAGAPASTSTVANAGNRVVPTTAATGKAAGKPGKLRGAGRPGGDQPGAGQGEPHGTVGDYVQLKPHGDTEILRHSVPNIGYKPTRFEQDWTPEGESSVDTALRHAVEKTTVKHTFHLPRGVRVECAVRPLLPIALFGCTNPDPPPAPVAEKVYDRLHLAPKKPLARPAPAASSAGVPTPMVKFDNSAECATARVAGGPLPPGCAVDDVLSPKPLHAPAASSSSWVPASDQFH